MILFESRIIIPKLILLILTLPNKQKFPHPDNLMATFIIEFYLTSRPSHFDHIEPKVSEIDR